MGGHSEGDWRLSSGIQIFFTCGLKIHIGTEIRRGVVVPVSGGKFMPPKPPKHLSSFFHTVSATFRQGCRTDFIFFSSTTLAVHSKRPSRLGQSCVSKMPILLPARCETGIASLCAVGCQSSNIFFSRSAKFCPRLFKTNKQTNSFC